MVTKRTLPSPTAMNLINKLIYRFPILIRSSWRRGGMGSRVTDGSDIVPSSSSSSWFSNQCTRSLMKLKLIPRSPSPCCVYSQVIRITRTHASLNIPPMQLCRDTNRPRWTAKPRERPRPPYNGSRMACHWRSFPDPIDCSYPLADYSFWRWVREIN